jgi:hypothetical protein
MMAGKKAAEVAAIKVKYTGDKDKIFAPGLGTFKKGEVRTFSDKVSMFVAGNLIKGNRQFEEVEK